MKVMFLKPHHKQHALAFALGVMLLGLTASPSTAQERQYKIEAAYLYSFFNYITWPNYDSPQALQNPTICVYGEDPIMPYLKYAQLKRSPERAFTIRTVNDGDNITGCNILFLRHRVAGKLLASIPDSILTVFKPDDPLDRGGMIELSEDEDRISMRINQQQLEKNGFKVSSRLLDLAQVAR